MDTIESYVRSFSESWISPYVPLLGLVLLCSGFMYVRARAGSTLFLHERIWRFLSGQITFANQDINEAWRKTVEYESFKFKTGIRFPSYAKIEETMWWLNYHKVGLEELILVRSYFDSKNVRLRSPCLGCFVFSLALAGVFLIASMILVIVFSFPAALLTIKDTGTVMWVQQDQNKARSWNGFSWVVDKESCGSSEYLIALSDQDGAVVCEILNEGGVDEYLDKVINQQRTVGYLLFFIIFLSIIFVIRLHSVAEYAKKISERVDSGESRQLEIEGL